jgi:hypothetical protein
LRDVTGTICLLKRVCAPATATQWLAGDDPERARSEPHEAIARWSDRAFARALPYPDLGDGHCSHLGDAEAASLIIRDSRRALQRSRLLRIYHLRIEWLHLLARSAIAAAALSASSETESRFREAEPAARLIDRERTFWASAMAALARAGIASIRGDPEKTMACLVFAEGALDGADMALYSAITRLRRGELLGGDEGQQLRRSATQWMKSQNIRIRPASPKCWRRESGFRDEREIQGHPISETLRSLVAPLGGKSGR